MLSEIHSKQQGLTTYPLSIFEEEKMIRGAGSERAHPCHPKQALLQCLLVPKSRSKHGRARWWAYTRGTVVKLGMRMYLLRATLDTLLPWPNAIWM